MAETTVCAGPAGNLREGPAERGAMKKNPQGKRWHRLDNTGKIFPMIANENLSNVFRISVTLKEEIDPGLLGQALEEVLPWFGGFKVKLKRGFFWYYFEEKVRSRYGITRTFPVSELYEAIMAPESIWRYSML